ncbi:uncharacterized protein LOC122577435 isoform X2 [Bombus pyrosoma]|uniref:uncharacterized protein LOC122577435 isoform X2 n=1 Tax=Bombus pyrosoma TaxID=396416 RepID=UPI001CB9AD24|nr:uncharacterized protein LOC122577435 isoform X2 [Bombus pyrosoma]
MILSVDLMLVFMYIYLHTDSCVFVRCYRLDKLLFIYFIHFKFVRYLRGSSWLCWLWTWKYLHLSNLYNARGGEIPKMCRRLVKTIQMNVRRLTSLRRFLPESWLFSCVTALVVRAIFSAVCSQYMERLRFGDYDLNGECGVVFVKGSLCSLSHARGRRVPKCVSGPRRRSQRVKCRGPRTKNRVTFVLIIFDADIYIYLYIILLVKYSVSLVEYSVT